MARKQVIVQLDDDLVEDLDALAEHEGVSRSELLRRGAAAVLKAADEAEKSRKHVESYRRIPQDPDLVAWADKMSRETMPPW